MKPKMSTSAFKAFCLSLVCCLGFAFPLRAEYFVIRDYLVHVEFLPDGALQFDETIEVEFLSERHGIFRNIPLVNIVQGRRQELIIKDVQVDEWPVSKEYQGNDLVLKIGDPDRYVNGRQTYRIRYRVENGLNFFEDHAEFYWDLLGVSWTVVIDSFRFQLDFPCHLQLADQDVKAFSGAAGSTGNELSFQLIEGPKCQRLHGATIRPFAPGEAVTVAVRLPKDAFPQPSSWDVWRQLHGVLLWPAGLLSAMLGLLFYSRNRRQAIATEYQPPLDISPVIAGGFIDHAVDDNDVLSLIPLLASKGYLQMFVEEKEQLWVFKSKEVRFVELKPVDEHLNAFERKFMNALFQTGQTVYLSSLRNSFYKHLADIRSEVQAWIKAQQWYEPDQRINRFIAYGAGAVCLFFGIGTFGRDIVDGLICLGAGLSIFILSRFFNQRNVAGNKIYQRLEGFRRFVVKAEKPMLERLLQEDPTYFDKTLPYAVAFGEVQRWTRQFDGLMSQPPHWYHTSSFHAGSPQRFNMDSFGSQFSSEMNTIGSVFSSSPSSSSSGGGSSGGGSGGGGGGSW